MRIKRLRIRNFRSYEDETLEFDSYTSLVGANGSGKSSVLCALNVFFREVRDVSTNLLQLQEEDFHNKNIDQPIEITVTFCDLSAEAQEDFKHYFRNGELTVTAIAQFDPKSRRAEVTQHGERFVMQEFAPFFAALEGGQLVAKLKELYTAIREGFPELPPAGTKDAMKSALGAYESAHPERCVLVPSPAQFYGFSKGINLLDRHIEWVYVPAVKDVTTEQLEGRANAFGRLVSRVVRSKFQFGEDIKQIRELAQDQYRTLLAKGASALDELSETLQSRVSQWAHPGAQVQLRWDHDQDKSVSVQEPLVRFLAGEGGGGFIGDLARFGHGLQRCYLLALLQELSAHAGVDGATLILAVEEPELYQHPPQARHLASVLVDLSLKSAQLIVSTHSPLFVAGDTFEYVRVVRKDVTTGKSSIRHARYEAVAARLAAATLKQPKKRDGMIAIMHRALQPNLNEMFFANRIVLLEGIEDAAYIGAYLHLCGLWSEFRRRGQHLVVTNGKSQLLEPVVIGEELGLDIFVVFDADGSTTKPEWRRQHECDNTNLLRALGIQNPDPFPANTLWAPRYVVWPDCLSETVKHEIGPPLWQSCAQAADQEWGQAGDLRKNPLHVASTLEAAWAQGARSTSLEKLCEFIVGPAAA